MLLLSSVARGAARVTYAFYPVATYMPQLYEVKRSGKDGFSSTTCLVVVLLSVLRVAFWIIRRVREWSYLVYSITLLLMQFYLLDAVISARRKKQAVPRRHGTTSAALASNLKKLFRTWIRGNREAVSALWRTLRLSFWAWDDLAPYVEVVVVASLFVVAVSASALRLFATRDAYSRFVGTCVAVCDVLVAAPQLRKNCVRGDTAGLSTLMVVAWFARDVLFLLNRRVASRQNEQLGALDEGKWRAQVVSSPRIGLAVLRVAADALLLAQIAAFSSANFVRAAIAAARRGDTSPDHHRRRCLRHFRAASSSKKHFSAFFVLQDATTRSYVQNDDEKEEEEKASLLLVVSDDQDPPTIHRTPPADPAPSVPEAPENTSASAGRLLKKGSAETDNLDDASERTAP
ncbi:hypothetical protein CTAYLR_009406 [Chrysophaeum taylorii]|uniref:Uncharacterized protein n=1 Tax=Chrysophaeum taylorii TaxID=2483200 RepID=A0AAD7XPJ9_9STRA|nr:hypothetical protein CTAYLR_009406 [Chrysophaeum taylorii]